MANFPHTPEALLGRNDSKNPATTCKGITSSGRPCRRALAASPNGKRKSSVSALNGVVALVEEDGRVQEADFYCWQHKDQAEAKVQEEQQPVKGGRKARRKRSAELFPLQERSSIDTLVQRLGIEAVPEEKKQSKKPERQPKPPKMTETVDFAERPGRTANVVSPEEKVRPARKPAKREGFWASLCCAASDKDDDYVEIVRHRRRTEQAQRPSQTSASAPPPPRIPQESRPSSTTVPARKPLSPGPPNRQRVSSNPQTNQFLSLIPQTCSPQTTANLLAELSKPISAADEEGYIYIFWLTPQSKNTPSENDTRSLLSPPEHRPGNSRRISDVMTEFSYDGDDEPSTSRGLNTAGGRRKQPKTIMLKIGRANNITRRMNEWQRQCGYTLNLVRWYPYIPSTPQASPNRPSYPDLSQPPRRQSDAVRRVPNVKRVERLIHLELAEKRVLRNCGTCGKEHREWFEVEASQEGVKGVDECVRRWVEWSERRGGVR